MDQTFRTGIDQRRAGVGEAIGNAVHREKTPAAFYGLTYRWGSSTVNAALVPEEGLDESFVIRDSGGGIVRTQTWHYQAALNV